jgi:hypothetical protein
MHMPVVHVPDSHVLPAQQGSSISPHSVHVVFWQIVCASLHMFPGQQASPSSPHGWHVVLVGSQ